MLLHTAHATTHNRELDAPFWSAGSALVAEQNLLFSMKKLCLHVAVAMQRLWIRNLGALSDASKARTGYAQVGVKDGSTTLISRFRQVAVSLKWHKGARV